MKRTITAILAIALMAVPLSATAHIEKWAEYDQRLEKEIAELQAHLPMDLKKFIDDIDAKITNAEKQGKVIITTMETTGKLGWIAMAEDMGGVEKFKAMIQRRMAGDALMASGLQIARGYMLRYRFVDNGKEICTVDVNTGIIHSMIWDFDYESGDWPEYQPARLPATLLEKKEQYEKWIDGVGPKPYLEGEEFHIISEFVKYSRFYQEKHGRK